MTGLSGSGKSTLAFMLGTGLRTLGHHVVSLDGDELRRGLSADLDFGRNGRAENVRRAAEVSAIIAQAGFVCTVALVSPFETDRTNARSIIERRGVSFVEVFVDAPVQVCEQRDTKGLYSLARAGRIRHFTGVSDPYEPPQTPDVHVKTNLTAPADCVVQIIAVIARNALIDCPPSPEATAR